MEKWNRSAKSYKHLKTNEKISAQNLALMNQLRFGEGILPPYIEGDIFLTAGEVVDSIGQCSDRRNKKSYVAMGRGGSGGAVSKPRNRSLCFVLQLRVLKGSHVLLFWGLKKAGMSFVDEERLDALHPYPRHSVPLHTAPFRSFVVNRQPMVKLRGSGRHTQPRFDTIAPAESSAFCFTHSNPPVPTPIVFQSDYSFLAPNVAQGLYQ
uniref:Uncharacterized protein n=1 Tax=Timema bartmani TaxID=61472 RepID=A0A7R9F370_9NEOP|nr:unnamed protein product [Timema bartmani]